MFDDQFIGKVALITGASRGIGNGILKFLAQHQLTVIGTSTTAAGAEKITHYLAENNLKGQGIVLNVTNSGDRESVHAAIKENFGPINILVNNAAITQDNLFLRMKEEEWSQVINTDLTAVFHLSKMVLRNMIKARWGRIINIGSVVADTGNPGQVNYCAAKAGIIGMTKALALEVGSRNITINTISPGYIMTDMTQALTEQQREVIMAKIPMQRAGAVEDIAALVAFLSSELAGYITGQTLHVNGGMFMN